jgi:hypothetical protein
MDNPEKLVTYTRRRKSKQKQNTNALDTTMRKETQKNVNKTWVLLQTTGGKDEPNIVFMQKS